MESLWTRFGRVLDLCLAEKPSNKTVSDFSSLGVCLVEKSPKKVAKEKEALNTDDLTLHLQTDSPVN